VSRYRQLFLHAATSLLLAAAMVSPADAAPPTSTSAPRILIYGDSLTHSFNADWTWRYLLWQSLTDSGQGFDFVGPRTDVVEYTTWALNSQGYRNPAFDRDHAALGGMKFLGGYYQIASLARTYRPQVIVGLIGTNDLLQRTATVADLHTHWREQIAQARNADRGVDFVLVPIPDTWIAGVVDYNAMLKDVAAELNTADERVVVASTAPLAKLSDTFDHVHLTTSGQLKVANVVSRALASIGIGSGQPTTKPDPPDDHTWGPQPAANVSGTTVTVTWPAVTYASSENVWARDRATGAVRVRRNVTGKRTTLTGTAGHSYDMWLEPLKGYLPIGTTSNTIRVDVPSPEPTPTPTAEPPPTPTPSA
jgi:lysophospholipase L1-like esterase